MTEQVARNFMGLLLEAEFYWYVTAVIGMAAIGFLALPDSKKARLIVDD